MGVSACCIWANFISSDVKRDFNYSALDSGITFPDKTAGEEQLSRWIRSPPPPAAPWPGAILPHGRSYFKPAHWRRQERCYFEFPKASGEERGNETILISNHHLTIFSTQDLPLLGPYSSYRGQKGKCRRARAWSWSQKSELQSQLRNMRA